MKKTVIEVEELQAEVPLLNNWLCRHLLKGLFKLLNVDKVNRIHSKYYQLRGAAFTSAMLSDPMMDVKYRLFHPERLDTLPEGAFLTVSNHPIGSLDGIVLIDIFAKRRADFRVMVNGLLTKIAGLSDNFISVKPNTGQNSKTTQRRSDNINGVRLSLEHLQAGHPMGFFPAGAMSFYDKEKRVRDLPWARSVMRLIRKSEVPVYPVYFDCKNSSFFYWLGQISWKIRTLRTPTEAFNKQGETFDVYIGEPISPETIRSIPDDALLSDFLYRATYDLKA